MISLDIFALLVTLVILGVLVYVIITTNKAVNDALQGTKENLKSKGLHVSSSGISVKTDKSFDQEAYLDATQRGFMRALNATSIHRVEQEQDTKHADVSEKRHHGLRSIIRTHNHQDEQEKKERDGGQFRKGKHSDKLSS